MQEFDSIPCGGTHCRSAGEVGLIKVTRWERRSGNTRVEFLCGGRALRDYRMKNDVVVGLAGSLSVRDVEVREAVARLSRETAESRHRAEQLRNRLLDFQAGDLARQAIPVGLAMVVVAFLEEGGPEELKHLAARLTSIPARIALLAAGGDRGHLTFARSEDLSVDMAALLRQSAAPHGGRGGGRANLAQGGAPDPEAARRTLNDAMEILRSQL